MFVGFTLRRYGNAFALTDHPPTRKDRNHVGSANPTHLKRQKEQKRKEKAEEKRAARLAKKTEPKDSEADVEMEPLTEQLREA